MKKILFLISLFCCFSVVNAKTYKIEQVTAEDQINNSTINDYIIVNHADNGNYYAWSSTLLSGTNSKRAQAKENAELVTFNDDFTDLTTAQDALVGTIIYCALATPTYETITDTTLLSQLEALKNASSYDTKTHITQNSNDKPFILNATALQKGEAIVNNEGNIYSKPTLDIEGSGTVGIYLDGNQMFTIDLSNSNECVIDTTKLEAYNPTTSELMNRQVTGDYSNFKLNAGDNQVEATGDITKVTISNYTRWL